MPSHARQVQAFTKAAAGTQPVCCRLSTDPPGGARRRRYSVEAGLWLAEIQQNYIRALQYWFEDNFTAALPDVESRRLKKPAARLVNCRSAPVSRSTSQRFHLQRSRLLNPCRGCDRTSRLRHKRQTARRFRRGSGSCARRDPPARGEKGEQKIDETN
jgi:hypothetical protein